jgi:hypothetical protein
MSEKNMEIAKRAMDAFNYSNFVLSGVPPFASLREFCDPDVEWDFSRLDGEISVAARMTPEHLKR